jgi:hypothetical protein
MANKLMCINVRGLSKKWGFTFYGDPQHVNGWQDDGLDVYVVENVIPAWVASLGLVKPWCFLQDVFNLKNPFK